MKKKEIPPEVRHFMMTSIPSIPHLEALMLARASTPDRWNAPSLAERLYITQARAAKVLADLHADGMLLHDAASSTYYYQRHAHAKGEIIERVATLYASNLVGITVLIHSKTERPIPHAGGGID
jgi:N-acetylmuramoyl-L-alanine amidase